MNDNPSAPDNTSLILAMHEVREIEGKLLTIVESIGLPEKQEEAVKGLVRQAIWDAINRPFREYIYGYEHSELYALIEKFRASKVQGSTGPSPIQKAEKK